MVGRSEAFPFEKPFFFLPPSLFLSFFLTHLLRHFAFFFKTKADKAQGSIIIDK